MLAEADISALSQREMASAALVAGVRPPNSDDSRELIRKLLRVFNGIEVPASEIPAPVTRDELAHAIQGLTNGLATVLQAAAQGADR
ncbi:hypothetical protein [Streptomyces qinglanensis]|uniref:hypothetical protein n=1 Tax=Streptomyces qinglanensis TaxID=943816 RepID=UPI003D765587